MSLTPWWPHSIPRMSSLAPTWAPANSYHGGSICSILMSRFMLSLRRFDSAVASVKTSTLASRVREHMASTVLEFRAHPSESLPPFIASFANPVHVESALSEMIEAMVEETDVESERCAIDAAAVTPTSDIPSEHSLPVPGQPPTLEYSTELVGGGFFG